MTLQMTESRPLTTFRPRVGVTSLGIIVALFLLFFMNRTFWFRVHDYLGPWPDAIAGLYVAMSAMFIAIMVSVSYRYIARPFFILMIVISASASWFIDRFGTVIDADMLRNVLETTPAEAEHLLTPGFAVHMLLLAILPAIFIMRVRVVQKPLMRQVGRNALVVTLCLLTIAATGSVWSKTWIAAIRQHKDIVRSLNPLTPVSGAVKFASQLRGETGIVVQPVGLDAKVLPAAHGAARPRVTIVVAGETARAADFSLGGYGRDTNPELAKRDVIYFPQTTSCGTATAVSLPCMFSPFTRADYSHSKAIGTESLVDVLAHAGIDVAWWDNNTGSKNVADRIAHLDMATPADPQYCSEGECLDGIFLDRLDAWLASVKGDSVLVLHQLGSHGPAYYRRYPDEFRRFRPDCRTAELAKCTDAEIVNAYDNTILYTDHILSSVIDRLKAHSTQLSGAMIYMSDHGESLGESGLYLHGTPYIFAPDTQTHIPFVMWLDPSFTESAGVDRACIQARAKEPHSHDDLFHTVLGMMNVSTKIRDDRLDIIAACRSAKAA